MSLDQPSEPEQVNASKARRSLRNGFITLVLAGALVVGLLLAVPGLKGVATTVSHMKVEWVIVAVVLEVLSCASYVVVFLQVFNRAPFRVGARVALSEEAFGAAVALGGVGSLAVGAWLMVERGAAPERIAERSAVLFWYTSAINVITLILAGLGLFLGLPGPSNPLLSIVPAAAGTVVLVLLLLLPRYVDRLVQRTSPGRLQTFLIETAVSMRDTERLVFRPNWRIVGAIGYLWFDIAVLFACFAAAGHVPPLAPVVLAYQISYLSNFIPVPGGIGVLDGSMIGMLVIYGVGGTVATAATLATTRSRCGSQLCGERPRSSCCRGPRSSRSSCTTRPRNSTPASTERPFAGQDVTIDNSVLTRSDHQQWVAFSVKSIDVDAPLDGRLNPWLQTSG